jgi:hypothetical protein
MKSLSNFTVKDSGEREAFKSGMVRDTTIGKVLWHLVASGPMLRRWAAHLTKGAIKYEPDNWLKASGEAELKRFKESAFRHFMQWYYELDDVEDHAAATIFNINGVEYVKGQAQEKSLVGKSARPSATAGVFCSPADLPPQSVVRETFEGEDRPEFHPVEQPNPLSNFVEQSFKQPEPKQCNCDACRRARAQDGKEF